MEKDRGIELGGSENPLIYEIPDTVPSCDKGGHKERSIAHQPNHLKHKHGNIFTRVIPLSGRTPR